MEIEYSSKENFTLPAGADVVKKSHRIRVEEIENGFLVTKSYDIEYTTLEGNKDYGYFSKRYYSKDNPMSLKIEDKDIELADKLD